MARAESRTRLPADLRRRQIALAAGHVFATQGLAGAKTRQIAEAADVTETILYRHFASKQEIFEVAILEPVERLATELTRLTAEFSRIDAKERLERSQQVHDQIRSVVQEITPLLGVALFSQRDAGRAFYVERLLPLFDFAADAIRQAMAPRQQRIVEPRVLLLAIVGMYFGISLEALFAERRIDWTRVSRDFTHLVAFGLFGPSDSEVEVGSQGAPATAASVPGRRRRARASGDETTGNGERRGAGATEVARGSVSARGAGTGRQKGRGRTGR